MKTIKKIFILLLAFIPTFVLADTGPKPTINVTLKNMKDSNYLIDLMSDFSNKENLIDGIVERYNDYKERNIYTYHEDNWYATAIRDFLLWGNIEGNSTHEHSFTYFGVPSEFKVIIEFSDGTLKVSEKIQKTSFNFDVTIDVNDMKVISKTEDKNSVWNFIKIIALTIVVETLIAFLFKTGKYYFIAVVNLITNACLQLAMMYLVTVSNYIWYFIGFELIVVGLEYLFYIKNLKISKTKILIYTLVANLVTAILTFII